MRQIMANVRMKQSFQEVLRIDESKNFEMRKKALAKLRPSLQGQI
jgi:hypothetical protein